MLKKFHFSVLYILLLKINASYMKDEIFDMRIAQLSQKIILKLFLNLSGFGITVATMFKQCY